MKPRNRTTGTRLRIVLEPTIALGPGKADLLQAIEQTGSIAAAGRGMGMSYKRAWSLIEEMNADFGASLVHTSKGGKSYGGAELTPTGKKILMLYRRMEEKANRAIRSEVRALRKLLPDISN
jgi:molybdate transport system regulatory protein